MRKGCPDVRTRTSPALTPGLRRQLERVAALPDKLIDVSDTPEITNWQGAERGRFFRPLKLQITLRIDADIIEFFRQKAPTGGYQSAINAALREAMVRERSHRVQRRAKRSA